MTSKGLKSKLQSVGVLDIIQPAMAKEAVIKLAGKQHYVAEGGSFQTDRIEGKEGDTIAAESVLLTVDGEKITVGTPEVKDAKVALKIVKVGKGEKVIVAKFRAKSRYRRRNGHRQPQTTLEVVSINA